MPDGGSFRAGLTTALFGGALLAGWWLGLFGPIIAELAQLVVGPEAAAKLGAASQGTAPAATPLPGGIPDLAPSSA